MKTGIYIRVSTEDQAKEGFSIPAQKEKLMQYCQIRDWDISGIYIDDGISGKNIEGRPELNRLLQDIKNKIIENIFVYKLDRLTRSTKDLINLVDFFNKENCAFNSLSEQIDTSSATGRMFIKLLGIIAELERETIAERIALGYEQKAREGHYNNKQGIYGYEYKDGTIIKNEQEAAIIEKIFNDYLSGKSLNTISIELNSLNIKTKRNGMWRQATIKQIITNSTYIGKVRYSVKNKDKYFEAEGTHEKLINEETFFEVQKLIEKRYNFKTRKFTDDEVIFNDVLYCGLCGNKMSTHKSTSAGKYYIKHRCYNAAEGRCNNKAITQMKLEKTFYNYISNIDLSEIKIDPNINKLNDKKIKEINIIEENIKSINEKKKKLQYLLIEDIIKIEDYQERIKELEENINKLNKEKIKNNKEIVKEEYSEKDIIKINELSNNLNKIWPVLPINKKREFINRFIKRIEVINSDGNYKLNIKFII